MRWICAPHRQRDRRLVVDGTRRGRNRSPHLPAAPGWPAVRFPAWAALAIGAGAVLWVASGWWQVGVMCAALIAAAGIIVASGRECTGSAVNGWTTPPLTLTRR